MKIICETSTIHKKFGLLLEHDQVLLAERSGDLTLH